MSISCPSVNGPLLVVGLGGGELLGGGVTLGGVVDGVGGGGGTELGDIDGTQLEGDTEGWDSKLILPNSSPGQTGWSRNFTVSGPIGSRRGSNRSL